LVETADAAHPYQNPSSFCEGSLDGGVAADRMKRALDRVVTADDELGEQCVSGQRHLPWHIPCT